MHVFYLSETNTLLYTSIDSILTRVLNFYMSTYKLIRIFDRGSITHTGVWRHIGGSGKYLKAYIYKLNIILSVIFNDSVRISTPF